MGLFALILVLRLVTLTACSPFVAGVPDGSRAVQQRPPDVIYVSTPPDVVDAMQVRAGRDGISLDVRVEGEPRLVPADGSRIERAAANLVLNALEHTASGGRVDVAVREEAGGWLCLSVSDTGEGIAADDLPHIWNRFFQAERSRSNGRRRNGAGLGLAIVKGIVEAHGGTVGVESRAGRGSTFTLRLKGARSNTEPLSIAGPESSQSR